MIQYNIIQIQCNRYFYIVYTLAILLLIQLTRAGTTALTFHWFYKPFANFCMDPAARAILLQNGKHFILFYKQFWEVRVQLQLDRPRTNMLFSPKEFHMFRRSISNYHGESDGSVALISPWKSAMFWNDIPNSKHESNVSDSVDFSVRRSIYYLLNYWVHRSVHLSVDFCVNHWMNF